MSLTKRMIGLLMMVAALGTTAGCGDDDDGDDDDDMTDGGRDGDAARPDGDGGGDGGGMDGPACMALGGTTGISMIIGDFVGRVLADDSINAYFLNASTLTNEEGKSKPRLVRCLEEQVGSATGCAGVTYTCREMGPVHAELGISTAEFNALAGHFVAAMEAKNVDSGVRDTVAGVLGGMSGVIVTDPDANMSLYHRLGGRGGTSTMDTPAGIRGAIHAFIGNVVEDPEINSFFGMANAARLETCLTRQVCQVSGGPCKYGEEVGASVGMIEEGVSAEEQCRTDMAAIHADMSETMPGGSPDTAGIDIQDFNALVTDLVTTLTDAGVPMSDITLVGGALAPLCPMIVVMADRDECPM